MKTYSAKEGEVERKWWVVDVDGKTLGRIASPIAKILLGKHKPVYTPHIDTGDFVVVVNAEKIKVTGKKEEEKLYRKHSGYPGGLKTLTFKQLKSKNPAKIIELAVWGMLPHNSLGRKVFSKLKVYSGPEHKHKAQRPEVLKV